MQIQQLLGWSINWTHLNGRQLVPLISVVNWSHVGEDRLFLRRLVIHKIGDWLLTLVVVLKHVARLSLGGIHSSSHRVLILLLLFHSVELPWIKHVDP